MRICRLLLLCLFAAGCGQAPGDQARSTLPGQGSYVSSVAFSPDGTLLASGSGDATVRLWRLESGESSVLRGHKAAVTAVLFTPDGTLISASLDGTMRLWKSASGGRKPPERRAGIGDSQVPQGAYAPRSPTILLGHDGPIYAMALSPDGRTLVSGGYDETIKLWDVKQAEDAVRSQVSVVLANLLSPLLFATLLPAPATLAPQASLPGHELMVSSLAFSGGVLYSGSYDGTVRQWDVARRKSRVVLPGAGGPMAAFERDYLAWVNVYPASEADVHLANFRTTQQAKLPGHKHAVLALAFSPDGKLASASMDHTVKLWDPRAHKLLHTYTGHAGWVTSVAFSPDGKLLASGSWDETVKVWNGR
jgi:WD40 repeat protein